ncbi:MAG: hypothetical protein KDI55_24810 [Anaerolineae bacterium]|nr:hypothetical protein [Anaerolineae bacterium]
MRELRRLWIICLVVAIAGSRVVPAHGQGGSIGDYVRPGERLVTLQPSLSYQGRLYTVHYFTTGSGGPDDSKFIYAASSRYFERNGITAVLVTVDGEPVTDEATMRRVLTLYRAAHYLSLAYLPPNLGNVDDTFADEFRSITRNPIFIEQQIHALFSTRAEETSEALRGILTAQIPEPTNLESFGQEVRSLAETGSTVVDAVDLTLDAAKYSNDRAVRQVAGDIRDTFRSWHNVTTQGTSYVELAGEQIEFFNALDVLSLGMRLMWLSDLQRERAEWLGSYIQFATGEARLDDPQTSAVAVVQAEANEDWVQRSNIVLDFVRDKAVDLSLRVTAEVLTKKWVQWSWSTFGKRATGHLVAGAASAVLLGFTLGNLLYGLDDLYNNFQAGERADELRLRFRTARMQFQNQARSSPGDVFDGDLAEQFRVAYMLESLAAAQMYRYYADGVDATVRQGLTALFNPIAWFKGKEWREAAEQLRQMGIDGELRAEEDVGHPEFLDVAVAMALERLGLGASSPATVVDDNDPAFSRLGPADFWQVWPQGYAGGAVWTYCETNKTVNSAQWSPGALPAGMYLVQAFVSPSSDDLPKPYTESARYRIVHAGAEASVSVNQGSAGGGWLDLGTYYFEGHNEYVELADQTGEPSGSRVVMFDAVRWMPVISIDPMFNATAQERIAYDVVLPGEAAQIALQVRNTGTVPWTGGAFVLKGDTENPAGVPSELALPGMTDPGSIASWDLDFRVSGAPGVRTIQYQMQHNGEPFGDVITGYVIVLPEELRDLEANIRDQIDHWVQQGNQAIEDLMRDILQQIQEALEQQASNFLDELLSGCTGSSALLGLTAATILLRRRRS